MLSTLVTPISLSTLSTDSLLRLSLLLRLLNLLLLLSLPNRNLRPKLLPLQNRPRPSNRLLYFKSPLRIALETFVSLLPESQLPNSPSQLKKQPHRGRRQKSRSPNRSSLKFKLNLRETKHQQLSLIHLPLLRLPSSFADSKVQVSSTPLILLDSQTRFLAKTLFRLPLPSQLTSNRWNRLRCLLTTLTNINSLLISNLKQLSFLDTRVLPSILTPRLLLLLSTLSIRTDLCLPLRLRLHLLNTSLLLPLPPSSFLRDLLA